MAGGRPSKYDDSFPELLIEHMAKGFSFETFGAEIGVWGSTIFDWVTPKLSDGTDNPRFKQEFSDAKKEGEHRCRQFWERIGVNAALGLPMSYTDESGNTQQTKNYNAAIWIFNMKNRFGWRDKSDVTTDDKPIDNTGHDALREIAEAIKDANRDNKPADPGTSPDQSDIQEEPSQSTG